MIQFVTNQQYPNRIQMLLNEYTGVLTQNGILGSFDPRRDLTVYVDGSLVAVRTFSFDSVNNRYLLYMENSINVQGVVQAIHHMPSPPFQTSTGIFFPSFAKIGTYSTAIDPTSSPTASIAVIPASGISDSPLTLIWNTTGIIQIEIVADNGVDIPIDSGLVTTQGFGVYQISGVSITTTFTLNAYDSVGHLALSPTTTYTVN